MKKKAQAMGDEFVAALREALRAEHG